MLNHLTINTIQKEKTRAVLQKVHALVHRHNDKKMVSETTNNDEKKIVGKHFEPKLPHHRWAHCL